MDGENGRRVIESEEFHLKDKEGRTRPLLAMCDNGPALAMSNAAGDILLNIGVGPSGGSYLHLGCDGEPRVLLTGDSKGSSLVMFDGEGRVRVRLGAMDDGPQPNLFGSNGQAQIRAAVMPDFVGVDLRDSVGKGSLDLDLLGGIPALIFKDYAGIMRRVWCVADNYSIAGRRVAAVFRPPPVSVALKGDATSRSAETTEETTKDVHHCKEPFGLVPIFETNG